MSPGHAAWWFMVAVAAFAVLGGCTGLGPSNLARDRFDYQGAISESWKRQTLLNLVKIRYAEAPVFLEVASIISQYSIAGAVGADLAVTNPPWQHVERLNGSALWYDRPTITYAPMTGEKFARNIMSPIPPAAIMSMIQSDWPIDFVLRLTCNSVNGVRNRSSGQMNERLADPQFDELLAAMRRVQLSDTVGVRVQRKGDRDASVVYWGRPAATQPSEDSALVRRILRLSPEAREFDLAYGPIPRDDREFALLTRSLMQILVELGAFIDVPREHMDAGLTYATPMAGQGPVLIRIRCCRDQPNTAFVAVPYKGCWFWIEDGDYESKRMLSLLMMFFSLMETPTGASAPVITVPAG